MKPRKRTSAVFSIFVVVLVFSAGPTFAADKPDIVIIRGDDIGKNSVTVPERTSLSTTLLEVPDEPSQPGPDSDPRPGPYALLFLGSGLVGISTLERRIKN